MRSRDIVVGGGEAWEVTSIEDEGRAVKVRLIAGAGVDIRNNEIPASLLQGRSVYRRIGDLEDVDAQLAADEVSRYVNTDELGYDPRRWAEAFYKRYNDSNCPDKTVLLGWFSRLIESGVQKAVDLEVERRREVRNGKARNNKKSIYKQPQKIKTGFKNKKSVVKKPISKRQTKKK